MQVRSSDFVTRCCSTWRLFCTNKSSFYPPPSTCTPRTIAWLLYDLRNTWPPLRSPFCMPYTKHIHKQIILVLPPPALPTRLHDYYTTNAQYTTLPSDLSFVCHTPNILVIIISCESQRAKRSNLLFQYQYISALQWTRQRSLLGLSPLWCRYGRQTWPLQHISLLRGFSSRTNHPFTPPPHTCTAHAIEWLFHDYCAIYDPPPPISLLFAIHYTYW